MEWRRNDRIISGYTNGSVGTGLKMSSTLQINSLSRTDIGEYCCVAINPMTREEIKSNVAKVEVEGK